VTVDLEASETDYPLCSGCRVHNGFYDTESKVISSILSTVKDLQAKFPSYSVIATGHSLGAALATLTAFDLAANGINNVKLFNYGSPRVGNTAFADWASSGKVPITRATHYKVINATILSFIISGI
jgi:predicted lipase